MTPFWGFSREVAEWVAGNIPGCERGFGACQAMGVLDDAGDLVAGMVFHNWDDNAGVLEISGASTTPRWLTKPVLWEMFNYPFNRAGCQMVFMRVAADNIMWNGRGLPRLLKSYGFSEHTIPRLYGRERDGVLFVLYDDVWRANGYHKQNKLLSEAV